MLFLNTILTYQESVAYNEACNLLNDQTEHINEVLVAIVI